MALIKSARHRPPRKGRVFSFLIAGALAAAPASPAAPASGPLPWAVWDDPADLPRFFPGDQVLLRSSHCPSGCRYDRTSAGDTRFLRIDGDEQILFEEFGPGAITRIWMTTGMGTSAPLSSSVRLRIRLDGEDVPRIDIALSELFAGTRPPFTPPLVADRLASSGGNVSYVPIPYRHGCRVSLVGAEAYLLWFQFTFHRLTEGFSVPPFTGAEDLSRWRLLLENPGSDPWTGAGGSVREGRADLAPGVATTIASFQEAGLVTRLRLDIPRGAWPTTRLVLAFDGAVTVDLAASDFFALGRGGASPTRSLLVGLDADGWLYCYFPMPFFRSATFELRSAVAPGSPIVPVRWEVRRAITLPTTDSGLFGAQRTLLLPSSPPGDAPLLSLSGRGKWVGLWAELSNWGTLTREYLEGDERVFVDGSGHPALYGTGVEDFFGGGFYFDQGDFLRALHGSPYHVAMPPDDDVTAAYRLLLTDAVPFTSGIRAGLEHGPTGLLPMCVNTVAYFYAVPAPALRRVAAFDVGDASAGAAARWKAENADCRSVTSAFEGEPMTTSTAVVCARTDASEFELSAAGFGPRLRLRRRFDAGVTGQAAEVWVNGRRAGRFPSSDPNSVRRFREVDLDLDVPAGTRTLRFRIVPVPGAGEPAGDARLTEIRWELWAGPPLQAGEAIGTPRRR